MTTVTKLEMAEKPYDLRERAFEFANLVLDVAAAIPDVREGNHICGQLAKSGTSIGANIEEADGSATKADKRHMFVVARKEAQETRYWLRIIRKRWPSTPSAQEALDEVTELKSILSTIIDKLS
ncbi:four helix bundle protein [bacterium]|nr:four helix bundle protein [bacterium]